MLPSTNPRMNDPWGLLRMLPNGCEVTAALLIVLLAILVLWRTAGQFSIDFYRPKCDSIVRLLGSRNQSAGMNRRGVVSLNNRLLPSLHPGIP